MIDINTQDKQEKQDKSAAAQVKKKEPPPFVWKLVGYSDGLTLTLLKSADKKDVEAQLERLEREGHYTGLAIYSMDVAVPPSPDAKKGNEATATTPVSTRAVEEQAKERKAGATTGSASKPPHGKKTAAQKPRPVKKRKPKAARTGKTRTGTNRKKR